MLVRDHCGARACIREEVRALSKLEEKKIKINIREKKTFYILSKKIREFRKIILMCMQLNVIYVRVIEHRAIK